MLVVLSAVLVITMVLNLFLLFVIRQMVLITNRQVQKHFSQELEYCTEELDEKLARLNDTQEQLRCVRQQLEEQKRAQKSIAVAREENRQAGTAAVVRGKVRYQSGESLETYRYIRDHMKPDYRDLVRRAVECRPESDETWDCCSKIVEKLDFDTVYRMITRTEEEQHQILEQVLTEKERQALELVAPEAEIPDFARRLDKVRQYIKIYSPEVVVQCGEKEEDQKQYGEVRVEYNPHIHEGIRLRVGSGVLDYSL